MPQSTDILMPKLGLTMTEGMLIEWHVNVGDDVSTGDTLFVVETEKVAIEVDADRDGRIGEIVVLAGETVAVGAVVARWQAQDSAAVATKETTVDASAELQETNTTTETQKSKVAEETQPENIAQARSAKRIVATPYARKLAVEHAIDLSEVVGTGPRGRIKAQDVRQKVGELVDKRSDLVADGAGHSIPITTARESASAHTRAMARRMVQSKQEVPHFYLFTEAEVSDLLELRSKLNQKEHVVRITVNDFLIAAIARALVAVPGYNRIWDDGDLISFEELSVGVAISTEGGLVAPVLKGLSGLNLDGIAQKSKELVNAAREGRLSADDMSGGAITLSNAGMFDVTFMAPIVNPPQSSILGVGSVRKVFRPDSDGQPVLRNEMGLVLAADHRLHDGASGLKFLNKVVDFLENPHELLRTL